jgi:hypothetical protein
VRNAALIVALAACTQGTEVHGPPWVPGPALPSARTGIGVAAIGAQLVAIGGLAGTAPTTEADIVDTAELSGNSTTPWQILPPLPVAGSQLQVAAVGTRIFVLGGFAADGTAFGDSYALDTTATGSAFAWASVTAMPSPRAGAAMVTIAPKVFLFGGAASATGPAVADGRSYDTEGDAWCSATTSSMACSAGLAIPDLPAARTQAAAIMQTDGTFVVAGGAPAEGAAPAADVWWLPPSLTGGARAWVEMTAMPTAQSDCSYGSIGGRLVCAGGAIACAGSAGTCATGSAQGYQAVQDGPMPDHPWCQLAALPAPVVGAGGAAIGARLFVVGGATTPEGPSNDSVYVYSSGDDPAVEPIPDTANDPSLCPD